MLLAVNFVNLSEPVPVWQFYTSLIGNAPSMVLQLMLTGMLAQELPKQLQVVVC